MGGRQVLLDPTQNSPEVRDFEKALLERVVGQDRAVRRLARVYQVYLAGLATPGRPLVNLLFLGPMSVAAKKGSIVAVERGPVSGLRCELLWRADVG